MAEQKKSWYARTFGRSFLSILFGNFFEKKNNTAGIIATLLVVTLCYVVIHNLIKGFEIKTELEIISNVIFVIIGYYFGAKQGVTSKDEDE